MTELSGNAAFLGPDEHRRAAAGDERLLAAAGRPAPGVELRLAPGTSEILVRAPQVMAGYWDDPAASAAALADGWLHTGDVGRIDDDGIMSGRRPDQGRHRERRRERRVTRGRRRAARSTRASPTSRSSVGPTSGGASASCAVVVDPARSGRVGHRRGGARHARSQPPRGLQDRRARSIVVDALPRNATGKVLKQRAPGQPPRPTP